MATLAITIASGNEAGATIRRFAQELIFAATDLPDRNPTGASVVLTFNDTPTSGTLGFTLAGGNLASTITRRV